jgi:hypothetical protein
MTATDILTRLKAATGPMEREEAQAIANLVPEGANVEYALLTMALQRGHGDCDSDENYENVGAALALVERMLPKWSYTICRHYCELRHPKSVLKDVVGTAPTPALAILCALFGALAAKEAEETA